MYNLFSSKEVLINDLGYCKLFDIKYNGKLCTKMYLINTSPAKYDIFRSIKHPNILPIYKITTHSVYTKKLIPLEEIKNDKFKEYNEYLVCKLRDTVTFIHEELNLDCNRITEKGLFVDTNGNLVLGDFQEYTVNKEKESIINKEKESIIDKEKESIIDKKDSITNKKGSIKADSTRQSSTEDSEESTDEISDWSSTDRISRSSDTDDARIVNSTSQKGNRTNQGNRTDHYNKTGRGNRDMEMVNQISKSIANKDLNEIKDYSEVFKILENPEDLIQKETNEKREIAKNILKNRDCYPIPIKRNVLKLFLDDISDKKNDNNDYKVYIANLLLEFDEKLFREYAKSLFGIMNTSIRLILLEKLKNLENLSEFLNELCLGLQVKERNLKSRTIQYIFDSEATFSNKDFITIFGIIQKSVTDEESIEEICIRLIKMKRNDLSKPIYKLLNRFLELNKARGAVLRCLLKYYDTFDMYKISVELLPLLCSQLSYAEDQDTCFQLVDKVLEHLRNHKEKIRSKDWSLKKITKIFSGKKKTRESIDDKIDKMRIGEPDEWDEREFK